MPYLLCGDNMLSKTMIDVPLRLDPQYQFRGHFEWLDIRR